MGEIPETADGSILLSIFLYDMYRHSANLLVSYAVHILQIQIELSMGIMLTILVSLAVQCITNLDKIECGHSANQLVSLVVHCIKNANRIE